MEFRQEPYFYREVKFSAISFQIRVSILTLNIIGFNIEIFCMGLCYAKLMQIVWKLIFENCTDKWHCQAIIRWQTILIPHSQYIVMLIFLGNFRLWFLPEKSFVRRKQGKSFSAVSFSNCVHDWVLHSETMIYDFNL